MANLVKNYQDSPVSGDTAVWTLPQLNFGKDFRASVDDPGKAIVTNITSAMDAPETFQFAQRPVKDMYSGTSIDPEQRYAVKGGSEIYVQLRETWSVESEDAAHERVLLPVSSVVTVKIPRHPLIKESDVLELVQRTAAGLYETGDNGTTRVCGLVRGALMPSDL